MSLIPYDPMRQVDQFRKTFDRFFDEFPFMGMGTSERQGVNRVDIVERENEVIAYCEIPGLESKNDVHIEVDNHKLSLSGTIQHAQEMKDDHVHHRERFKGKFHRSMSLPTSVQADAVTATYKNGILEVHMPKMKSETRRKIDVQFH
jgi:HSP20 family protein